MSTDNYPSYGGKNRIQLNSVISVVNHIYKFELVQNTFNKNSATKSIVHLEFFERSVYQTVILSNVFNNNGAYYEGGAIYLRARAFPSRNLFDLTSINT